MILKVFLDAILIAASFVLAYFFRFKILLFITPSSFPIFEHYFRVMIFVVLLWLAIFKLIGLYDSKRFSNIIDEIAALFLAVMMATLVLLGLLFLYREFWFSRLVIVNAWWIAFILLGLARVVVHQAIRFVRRVGWGAKNILILGAGEMGQLMAVKITQDPALGYRAIGFLDDDSEKAGQIFSGVRVLGPVSQVKNMIIAHKADEIIFASSKFSADKILDLITECERYKIGFRLVPGILELIASRIDADELGGIPLLTVSEIKLQGLNAWVKRATDIALSLIIISLISPILLVFALLVKLTSPGPVLFRQKRIGLDEKEFFMFKFRSMVNDAEKLFPNLEPLSEVEGIFFKMKDDPRMTPLGKFMRRWSIDELPQLFNVLFGQMSLVGPRPPLPREVLKYTAWHKKRLRVRPGITGMWQVSGRSLLPFEEMVRLDIYYIENWSLWLDFKILLMTGPVVLTGSGAY